jgi:hypothetical protein
MLCFFIGHPSSGQVAIVSPINGKVLSPPAIANNYTFLLAGHIYGSHNKSIFPSASILANLDLLNGMTPDFMILLGDIVQRTNEVEIAKLKESFLSRVDFPVFNSVGNHDISDRVLYEEHFGKTFFSFEIGTELFISLDSEYNNGKIENEQHDFLIENIKRLEEKKYLKNIFIFSHRLLWAIANPPFDGIIPHVNAPDCHPPNATTISDILLKLKSRTNQNFYFASGDIGCWWSLPLFYAHDPSGNITYVATGIGDTEKDAIIKVDINNGEVKFTPISLTGEALEPLKNYSFNYWEKYFEKKINNKSESNFIMIYFNKIYRMFLHKYFWAGILLSVGISFFILIMKHYKKSLSPQK